MVKKLFRNMANIYMDKQLLKKGLFLATTVGFLDEIWRVLSFRRDS
jgi:hypothetical protein